MSDSALTLLEAVKTLLKADAAVEELVDDRVFAAVPPNPTYPYVRISATSAPDSTQTYAGMKHTLRVQAFSQDSKPGVPLAIRSAVYDTLNRQEHLLGIQNLVLIEQDGIADCFPQEDGKTYQSIIEFTCIIQ